MGAIVRNGIVYGGGGTSDYTDLDNKPSIQGVTLSGNKTLSQLFGDKFDVNTSSGWFTLYTGDITQATAQNPVYELNLIGDKIMITKWAGGDGSSRWIDFDDLEPISNWVHTVNRNGFGMNPNTYYSSGKEIESGTLIQLTAPVDGEDPDNGIYYLDIKMDGIHLYSMINNQQHDIAFFDFNNVYNKISRPSDTLAQIYANGQNQYCKFAEITIDSEYAGYPIVFQCTSDGRQFSTIQVMFSNENSDDPSLVSFTSDSDTNFYIKKTDTSEWSLYYKFNDLYLGKFSVYKVINDTDYGVTDITFTSTLLNELPADCTQVTSNGGISSWDDITDKPDNLVYFDTEGSQSGSPMSPTLHQSDLVANLTTTIAGSPLDATQGKVLKDYIDTSIANAITNVLAASY